MIYISPSLLAADFSRLGEEVESIEKSGANYLHLDVMDGMFVPNISFGPGVISAVRKNSSLIFDVHLMIKDPQRYIDEFIRSGADIITVHAESCKDAGSVLRYIRDKDVKTGIAISPKTKAETVFQYLEIVNMVLVMTVNPGFGGQAFMPEMIPKIFAIKKEILSRGLKVNIGVDGGINTDNIGLVTSAGANVIVAGSAVFKAKKPSAAIKKMRECARKNPYTV